MISDLIWVFWDMVSNLSLGLVFLLSLAVFLRGWWMERQQPKRKALPSTHKPKALEEPKRKPLPRRRL